MHTCIHAYMRVQAYICTCLIHTRTMPTYMKCVCAYIRTYSSISYTHTYEYIGAYIQTEQTYIRTDMLARLHTHTCVWLCSSHALQRIPAICNSEPHVRNMPARTSESTRNPSSSTCHDFRTKFSRAQHSGRILQSIPSKNWSFTHRLGWGVSLVSRTVQSSSLWHRIAICN